MPALSDKDIVKLLRSRELIIHPILDRKQISGGKVDLRLDNIFYFITRFRKPYYNPMEYATKEEEPETYCEPRIIHYGEPFILHPGDYALAPLLEFVKLPKSLIGRLDGRSSLGRLGVVIHSTAGSVDPGYAGPLIMELMNNGMLPVALFPLMRVATLILMPLTSEAENSYEGKYGKLEDFPNVESRLHKDPDLKTIMKMKSYV